MELDIFIPSAALALEYQGGQHFASNSLHGSPDDNKKRDAQKRRACKEAGITLIEIPFWWDREQDSIAATIHSIRPDLIPHPPPGSKPIPLKYPNKKFMGLK